MMPDTSSYLGPARSLVAHGTFLNEAGLPETVRTPGFPTLVALTTGMGWGLVGVVVLQHLLALGMGLLAGWVVRRRGRATALACAGLTWCSFLLAVYPNFLLSEILFAFLCTALFAALVAALRPDGRTCLWVALAAACGGGAVLVRPIGLLLFVPTVLCLLLLPKGRRLRPILLFLIVFALAPLSWMARNHAEFGRFTLSDITDVNLLGYQAAGTLAMREGGDYAVVQERLKRQLMREAETRFEAGRKDGETRSLNAVRRSLSLEVFRENPGYLLLHMARNVALTLLGNATSILARLTGWPPAATAAAAASAALAMLLLAAFGLVTLLRARDYRLAVSAFLFVGYFVGMAAVGGVGGSRFRIPAEPILCVLAGLAVADLLSRLGRKRGSTQTVGRFPK